VRADPESPEAWAEALGEAQASRAELVARGAAHAARFTTHAMGVAFLEAYAAARR
jgi:hypothetical protein